MDTGEKSKPETGKVETAPTATDVPATAKPDAAQAAAVKRAPKPKSPTLLSKLRAASANLLFLSESESAVKPFVWPATDFGAGITPDAIAAKAKLKSVAPPDTTDLDMFFRAQTTGDDPSLESDRARFAALVALLKSELKDVKVYRFGEITRECFAIGIAPTGEIAGVRVRVVET